MLIRKNGKESAKSTAGFFLGLLNFDIRHLEPEQADPARFIHKFSLREDETHEPMSRALRFAFLEVKRFDKPKEECQIFEEKFLYIMKNLPTFVEKPELWDDPYFDEFMEESTFASMTFEEQEQYIASMKQKWDYKNTMDFAEQRGRKEGLEQGLAQGLEQGLTQGKEQMARKLKELGVDIAAIAQSSGLTEEQVRAL